MPIAHRPETIHRHYPGPVDKSSSAQFCLRVDPEALAAIDRAARDLGITRSDLVRDLLGAFLADRAQATDDATPAMPTYRPTETLTPPQ